MTELQRQCLAYFKKEGFKRFMIQLKEKYQSLGHIGGTIVLSNLTEIEKNDLNGFLRVNLSQKKDIRIAVSKVEKLLLDTKFSDISLEELLYLYFGYEISSNKEIREQKEKTRNEYFQGIIEKYTDTPSCEWLSKVLNQRSGIYLTLIQRYEADSSLLYTQLIQVMNALNNLPVFTERKLRLPVFASEITQNPHSFDEQKDVFTLLLHGICTLLKLPYHSGMNAQERMEVLYSAGIQKDDVSNFTTVFRMYGYQNGEECKGWQAFAHAYQPLQLSLMNLNDLTAIKAEQYVFVVENPSVFSTLVECCVENKIDNVSLMCTYGQLRIASYLVLDLLSASNIEFYYAGDFDPEGLQIAQGILKKYPNHCKVWRYKKSDYTKAVSKKMISATSRKKLAAITATELEDIKQCLLEYELCAYQEQLLDDYCKDIIRLKV